MSHPSYFLIVILTYAVVSRYSLTRGAQKYRAKLFAAINILTFGCLGLLVNFDKWLDITVLELGPWPIMRHFLLISSYVVLIVPGFYLMRYYAKRDNWLPWIAFFYPIFLLIIIKYLHFPTSFLLDRFDWDEWVITLTFVGLSYMAFRLSYLVIEVRNGAVSLPTLSEYLGFAFFVPTIVVGPINPFSTYQRSMDLIDVTSIPVGRSLIRILVGLTKYLFLANLANQLTYGGIFLDGKPHEIVDLVIAVIFYYIFLYLNFSGFCDMGIGLSGLLGVRVKENFNNPFAAKNVKDFWNRWHITLSEYTRDVLFAPLSKNLIARFGARHTNLCISIAILAVFIVIGIWHGVGIRFAIFGLIHAAGVIGNHYYTVWMKRWLGKERYKAYNQNSIVNALATVSTFMYVATSFVVFANDRNMLGIIRNALR